jgi:hypothetical protein
MTAVLCTTQPSQKILFKIFCPRYYNDIQSVQLFDPVYYAYPRRHGNRRGTRIETED